MPISFQTPVENGDMKERRDGGSFVGLRYSREMPRFINGIVKSTALSRSDVIVRSVMAKSARYKDRERDANNRG